MAKKKSYSLLTVRLNWFDSKGKWVSGGTSSSHDYRRMVDFVRAIQGWRSVGEQGMAGLGEFDDPLDYFLLITWDKGAKLCLRSN